MDQILEVLQTLILEGEKKNKIKSQYSESIQPQKTNIDSNVSNSSDSKPIGNPSRNVSFRRDIFEKWEVNNPLL